MADIKTLKEFNPVYLYAVESNEFKAIRVQLWLETFTSFMASSPPINFAAKLADEAVIEFNKRFSENSEKVWDNE